MTITRNLLFAACAIALFAACSSRSPANNSSSASSSASGNSAAAARPLTGQQALAVAKQREDHMKAFGDDTKKAHNALQSSTPDLATIRQAAADMDALAPKLLSWFPQGTAVGVGESRAKPEIWQKPEDFALKAHDFAVAAKQFDVAARSGDIGQINTTFGALGKACKACHDLYRAPEKH